MSKDNISDEELSKLLGELGQTDPLNSCDIGEGSDKEDVIVKPKPRKKPEPTMSMIDVSIDENPEPVKLEPVPAKSEDLPAVFNEQMKRVASQYSSVFEEIIKNYKKDRDQAQEVIDYFLDVIATGGKIPRVYLEKVADAVRAKNEIAQTAIRALDSLPKLISSTKGSDMFQQNIGISFDSAHLREILDAAKEKEEEK